MFDQFEKLPIYVLGILIIVFGTSANDQLIELKQFEDDCFASVDELIMHYVETGKPVSVASGAIVTRPKNRSDADAHLYAPLQHNGCSANRAHVRSHSSMSSGGIGPSSSPTPSSLTHRSDGQVWARCLLLEAGLQVDGSELMLANRWDCSEQMVVNISQRIDASEQMLRNRWQQIEGSEYKLANRCQ